MQEMRGVLAAVGSSALGGVAVGVTRYLMPFTDSVTLAMLRFGLGCVFLIPIALVWHSRWPARRDWPATVALGLLFFSLFPALFNESLFYTSAAHGALVLSALPLVTMLIAALLKVERLSVRKSVGVFVAVSGVAIALLSGLKAAPAQAWIGDLLMLGATACMGIYSVLSGPIIARSSPLGFTIAAMAVGALVVTVVSCVSGGFRTIYGFEAWQWVSVAYLGIFGSAVIFLLWSFALAHTSPTRVAVSVTVNPVTASLVGAAFLGEALYWTTLVGLVAVFIGIGIATSNEKKRQIA